MADHLTRKGRSWNMSRIRSHHSKPEVIVRSLLHRSGYRFRINDSKLPGCPDIVLAKYKTAILVNGCFWHRHENCSRATTPGTNKDYWQKKFEKNVWRDNEVRKELEKLNWRTIIVWECEIMNGPHLVLNDIVCRLGSGLSRDYSIDMDRNRILKLAEKRSNYLLNKEKRNREK